MATTMSMVIKAKRDLKKLTDWSATASPLTEVVIIEQKPVL